jgi:BirA family biotin operon repressor/biotin-[acetyl-CoA-carboxylase] ligase
MSEAVSRLLDSGNQNDSRKTVGVKWPNDVLVDDLKISGVLSELVSVSADEAAVVVGAGINLSQDSTELPVPTATSLTMAGAMLPESLAERFDFVLASYLERLTFWYQRFLATDLDPISSGLRQAVIDNCVSLGRQVRAILPGESELVGKALTIDDAGRIVLSVNGLTTPVAAGDIVHLRHN